MHDNACELSSTGTQWAFYSKANIAKLNNKFSKKILTFSDIIVEQHLMSKSTTIFCSSKPVLQCLGTHHMHMYSISHGAHQYSILTHFIIPKCQHYNYYTSNEHTYI